MIIRVELRSQADHPIERKCPQTDGRLNTHASCMPAIHRARPNSDGRRALVCMSRGPGDCAGVGEKDPMRCLHRHTQGGSGLQGGPMSPPTAEAGTLPACLPATTPDVQLMTTIKSAPQRRRFVMMQRLRFSQLCKEDWRCGTQAYKMQSGRRQDDGCR